MAVVEVPGSKSITARALFLAAAASAGRNLAVVAPSRQNTRACVTAGPSGRPSTCHRP